MNWRNMKTRTQLCVTKFNEVVKSMKLHVLWNQFWFIWLTTVLVNYSDFLNQYNEVSWTQHRIIDFFQNIFDSNGGIALSIYYLSMSYQFWLRSSLSLSPPQLAKVVSHFDKRRRQENCCLFYSHGLKHSFTLSGSQLLGSSNSAVLIN